jgi:geranylgeranyl diphosphate/geranylgeranyl-bacteriochlorophyllide a reductase
MNKPKTIAVIGGGPAGAMAAATLAARSERQGSASRVLVFEERQPWEKPCGGGLPYKALRRYPFLLEAAEEHRITYEVELIGPEGSRFRLQLHRPIVIYSRRVLNDLLLRRARRAGAEIVMDRIRGFQRTDDGWELAGRSEKYSADFLVLAAGARTRLRNLLVPDIPARDFMLTFGYFVPGVESMLRVQFFEGFEGYAWSFPRVDHRSIGICGKTQEASMPELRGKLRDFMTKFGYVSDGAQVFSHLLPSLGSESWRTIRLAGERWAITGDSGGLVDPVTGEGIYYAMRSGELLAEALGDGVPAEYPARVEAEFGSRMTLAARLAPHLYNGDFLGKPWTHRLVQYGSRSRSCESLVQDLIDGSQNYLGLPRRIYSTLAKGFFEMGFGSLRRQMFGQ